MSRTRYVFRDGKFIEASRANEGHTSSAAPAFIPDSMNAVQHPVNGQWYDSKSAFRKTTKAHGCIEVGNSPMTASKPTESRQETHERKQAISEALRRYGI